MPSLTPARVLIVDDERVIRAAWQKMLVTLNPTWGAGFANALFDEVDVTGNGTISMAELQARCWDISQAQPALSDMGVRVRV